MTELTSSRYLPLSGKIALVTGGSRSIGASIAQRLAADGAQVAFTYRGSPAKAEEVAVAIEKTGARWLLPRMPLIRTRYALPLLRRSISSAASTFW